MRFAKTMTSQWKLFLLFVLIGFIGSLALRSPARDRPDPAVESEKALTSETAEDAPRSTAIKGLLLDLENANCPVLGNPVDGKTYSEWNGLLVGH